MLGADSNNRHVVASRPTRYTQPVSHTSCLSRPTHRPHLPPTAHMAPTLQFAGADLEGSVWEDALIGSQVRGRRGGRQAGWKGVSRRGVREQTGLERDMW